MAQQLPPGLWLTAEDACILDRLVRRAVYEAGRRDGHVPRRVVEIAEAVHRTALDFQAAVLHEPASGTTEDDRPPAAPLWPPSAQERLTAQQAARLTGVSRELISRLAAQGVLTGTKAGQRGSWELDPSSVAAWQAGRSGRAA